MDSSCEIWFVFSCPSCCSSSREEVLLHCRPYSRSCSCLSTLCLEMLQNSANYAIRAINFPGWWMIEFKCYWCSPNYISLCSQDVFIEQVIWSCLFFKAWVFLPRMQCYRKCMHFTAVEWSKYTQYVGVASSTLPINFSVHGISCVDCLLKGVEYKTVLLITVFHMNLSYCEYLDE